MSFPSFLFFPKIKSCLQNKIKKAFVKSKYFSLEETLLLKNEQQLSQTRLYIIKNSKNMVNIESIMTKVF